MAGIPGFDVAAFLHRERAIGGAVDKTNLPTKALVALEAIERGLAGGIVFVNVLAGRNA